MSDAQEPQRLVLWAPPARVSAEALAAAIAAGDVAAAVLAGAEATDPAVGVCQQAGVAAMVTHAPVGAADGLHTTGAFADRLAAVRGAGGAMVGAEAVTKHEAMELGDAGAAYIWFGTPDLVEPGSRDLAAWWAALFEVPAVAAGAATLSDVADLVATGAEFVALGPALMAEPGDAAAAVAHAQACIEARLAAPS